jgi:hypothetical protein
MCLCLYAHRIKDAIQCSNRALLGADQAQTFFILRNVAKLYDSLGSYAEAARSHRRLIQIAVIQERHIGEVASSHLYVAQYELDMLYRKRDTDDIKPGVMFELQPRPANGKGKSIEGPGVQRDVASAMTMLKKVIESNAPEKETAEEDLRYIRRRQEAIDLNVSMRDETEDGSS